MTFGQSLKRLLEEKEISRDILAKQLGLSYSAVSKYLNDDRKPDMETVSQIATLLGVSVDFLIGHINEYEEEVSFNSFEGLWERLRQAREKMDLKQNKVAKILGIHPSTLAKYESGERDPDTDILARLAELYNESVDWLLTGKYVSTSNNRGFDPKLNTDISDLTLEEIDFLNQLKQEASFKDFLKGPEEQKKSLVDTVKFLMRGMTK